MASFEAAELVVLARSLTEDDPFWLLNTAGASPDRAVETLEPGSGILLLLLVLLTELVMREYHDPMPPAESGAFFCTADGGGGDV